MGIVASDAIGIILGLLNRLPTVQSLLEIGSEGVAIVAVETRSRIEEIPPPPHDFTGIRMCESSDYVGVTILAGYLAMCRDMVFELVHKPRSGHGGTPMAEGRSDQEGKNNTDRGSPISRQS